ncbi:MAG TPA: Rrf2 family transcriptional regulator, partial [Thermoguttaceae bacterium]|nr:Rrf2 family transcriptional regulator [Thermoguttaceae bacterium]
MKLSRTVAYGLQATLQLAQADSDLPIPCSRLASQGSMPERFLLQILRNLVSHGILGSTRGAEGGYTLQRDLEEISLLDVIEAIDGPMTAASATGDGLSAESKTRLDTALKSITKIA